MAALCSRREILEVKLLVRTHADAGQLRSDFLFLRSRGSELESEVEIVEEVRLYHFLVDLWEIDLRRGGWSGLLEESRKRLSLVAGLDLFDVWHISRVEELGAVARNRKLGGGAEHFLDARRGLALPIGADHHVVAGFIAGGAAADIAVVESVAILQLHRVIAALFHGRNREHHRLGTQIHPKERIRRVAVRRDDGGVLVGEDAGLVLDLVERRLELPGVLVHGIFVHRPRSSSRWADRR